MITVLYLIDLLMTWRSYLRLTSFLKIYSGHPDMWVFFLMEQIKAVVFSGSRGFTVRLYNPVLTGEALLDLRHVSDC